MQGSALRATGFYELGTATNLARVLRETGRRDEARAMLAEVYDWFTEGFDTRLPAVSQGDRIIRAEAPIRELVVDGESGNSVGYRPGAKRKLLRHVGSDPSRALASPDTIDQHFECED